MLTYCQSCERWLELPDDIEILRKLTGKRFVVHEGRAHTILTGKYLERMRRKNPPSEEIVNGSVR